MKKFFAPALGILVAALFFGLGPEVIFAQTRLIDEGDNPSVIGESTGAWGGSLRSALLTILNFFLFFLGLVATGFIIYGGFLYITAAGDDGKVENAKKILMYAVIGILVILLSFALVNTIIGAGAGERPASTGG